MKLVLQELLHVFRAGRPHHVYGSASLVQFLLCLLFVLLPFLLLLLLLVQPLYCNIQSSTISFMHACMHASMHSCIHSFIHSFIHSAFLRSDVHPFILMLVRSFVRFFPDRQFSGYVSLLARWRSTWTECTPKSDSTRTTTENRAANNLLEYLGHRFYRQTASRGNPVVDCMSEKASQRAASRTNMLALCTYALFAAEKIAL